MLICVDVSIGVCAYWCVGMRWCIALYEPTLFTYPIWDASLFVKLMIINRNIYVMFLQQSPKQIPEKILEKLKHQFPVELLEQFKEELIEQIPEELLGQFPKEHLEKFLEIS